MVTRLWGWWCHWNVCVIIIMSLVSYFSDSEKTGESSATTTVWYENKYNVHSQFSLSDRPTYSLLYCIIFKLLSSIMQIKLSAYRTLSSPNCYTDLTWMKHKRPLHCAPNHESLEFFKGFHLSELGMDVLKVTHSIQILHTLFKWDLWSDRVISGPY